MQNWLFLAVGTAAGVGALLAILANMRIDTLERELEELRKK